MDKNIVDNRKEISTWKVVVFAFVFLTACAFVVVFIWDTTSEVNKPANALDFKVRTPANNDDWFQRNTTGL